MEDRWVTEVTDASDGLKAQEISKIYNDAREEEEEEGETNGNESTPG